MLPSRLLAPNSAEPEPSRRWAPASVRSVVDGGLGVGLDDIGAIKLDTERQATLTVHGERFVAVGAVVAELLGWADKGDPAPYR